MEEGAHSLSNDDLLRLISFLEYDVLPCYVATAVAARRPSRNGMQRANSRQEPAGRSRLPAPVCGEI